MRHSLWEAAGALLIVLLSAACLAPVVSTDEVPPQSSDNVTACPPPDRQSTCVNNSQLQEVTRTFSLVHGRCSETTQTSVTKLTDCTKYESRFECPDGSCDGFFVVYQRVYKECNFEWIVERKTPAKCCCKDAGVRSLGEEFDENLNAIRTTTVTVTWVDGACRTKLQTETRSLQCQGECQLSNEECRKNANTVSRTLTCFQRDGTTCRNTTRTVEVDCSGKCVPEITVEKEDCVGDQEVRTVRRFMKMYNPHGKKCTVEEISRVSERCSCPASMTSTECLKDRSLARYTSMSYLLANGTCQMSALVEEQALQCTIVPRQTSKTSSATGEDGYYNVTEVYSVADGCNCVQRVEEYRKLQCCSCQNKQVTDSTCENRTYSVTKQTSSVYQNETCAITTTSVKQEVLCLTGEQVKETACQEDVEGHMVKTVTRSKFQFQDCHCKEVELQRTQVYCSCNPRNVTSSYCNDTLEVTETVGYKLVNNTCTQVTDRVGSPVKCPAPSTTFLTETCDASNKRTAVTVSYQQEGCQCVRSETSTQCACSCQEPMEITTCDPTDSNYQLVTSVTLEKAGVCGCRNVNKTRKLLAKNCNVNVPDKPITACNTTGMVGYLTVQQTQLTKDPQTCNCIAKVITIQKLCNCKPKLKSVTICSPDGRKRTTIIYKHGPNANYTECIWSEFTRSVEDVVCNTDTKIENCNETSNIFTVEHVSYVVKNCVCIRQVDLETSTCRCDPTQRVTKVEDCDPDSCKRTIYYTYQKRNNDKRTCENATLVKQETCCCPEPDSSTKCDPKTNEIVHRDVSFTIKNDMCLKAENETREEVPCDVGVEEVRDDCNPKNRRQLKGTYSYYRRVLNNCKCEWELQKKVEGDCVCPDTQVLESCDTAQGQLTTATVVWRLNPPFCTNDTQTVKKPVTCPGNETQTGECDLVKGVRIIRDTTYKVDVNCRCYKEVTDRQAECNCERLNKFSRGCNQESNQFWEESTNYTLQGDVCIASSARNVRDVTCQNLDQWTLFRRGENCLPLTGDGDSDFGLRQDVYHKTVKFNCSCQTKTKTVDCHCRCTGLNTTVTCNNNIRTNIEYQYKWDENQCRCQRIELNKVQSDESVCPSSTREETACSNTTCLKTVMTYTWQRDGCSCVKKTAATQERCCCPANTTVSTCQSSGFNETVSREYILDQGQCVEKRSVTTVPPAPCEAPGYPVLVPHGECNKTSGVREWIYMYYSREGCDCVLRELRPLRPCICPFPIISKGECNLNTYQMRVNVTKFLLNNKTNKCEEKLTSSLMFPCIKCDAYEQEENKQCIAGRLLSTKKACTWDADKRYCRCRQAVKDLTPFCDHTVKIVKETCDGTRDYATETQIRSSLCNCECKENVTVVSRTPCQCSNSTEETVCVKQDKVLVTTRTNYILADNHCLKEVKSEEKEVKCEDNVLDDPPVVGECNLNTCQAQVSTSSRLVKNCTCIKDVVVTNKSCCCEPKTPVIVKTCDSARGVEVITNTSAQYDANTGKCVQSSVASENPIVCSSNVEKKVVGKCRAVEGKSALYRQVVVTSVQRDGCTCKDPESVKTEEPCGCENTTTETSCMNNVKITKSTSYSFDGSSCVPQLKIVDAETVKCAAPSLSRPDSCGEDGTRNATLVLQEAKACVCQVKKQTNPEPCKCKGEILRETCDGNVWKVERNVPVLECSSTAPCRCVSRPVSYSKTVVCDPPKETRSECESGRIVHKLQVYLANRCKCESQEWVQEIPCGQSSPIPMDAPPLSECTNEAGDAECSKLTVNNSCASNETIRNSQCQKMCGFCQECEGKFQFTRLDNGVDLRQVSGAQDSYFLFFLFYPSVEMCKSACEQTAQCKTFQIGRDVNRRPIACALSSLTPAQLRVRLANSSNIERQAAEVFYKTCRAQHCPPTEVVPGTKCHDTGRPDGAQRFVSTTLVTRYVPDKSGQSCQKVVETKTSPCPNDCLDKLKDDECAQLKASSQCHLLNNSIVCGKTCAKECSCNSSMVITARKCSAPAYGQKIKVTTYVLDYSLYEGFCTVTVTNSTQEELCEAPSTSMKCNGTTFIGKCVGNVRQVFYVPKIATPSLNVCISLAPVVKEQFPCDGCCTDVNVNPGRCEQDSVQGGFQRLVRSCVWKREGLSCKNKTYESRLKCDPHQCPADTETKGSCLLHKQPVFFRWFHYDFNDETQRVECIEHLLFSKVQPC